MGYVALIIFAVLIGACGGGPEYRISGESFMASQPPAPPNPGDYNYKNPETETRQRTYRPRIFYNQKGESKLLIPGSRNPDSHRAFYSDPQSGKIYYPTGRSKRFYYNPDGDTVRPSR